MWVYKSYVCVCVCQRYVSEVCIRDMCVYVETNTHITKKEPEVCVRGMRVCVPEILVCARESCVRFYRASTETTVDAREE